MSQADLKTSEAQLAFFLVLVAMWAGITPRPCLDCHTPPSRHTGDALSIGENRSMPPTDFIPGLNHLVEINKDAEEGFSNAAQNVRNSELESLFIGYAKQHAKFAAELQKQIERLGGHSTDSGTIGGALHRGWMDLKSALSGHSAAVILTSCETGEQSAVAAYAEAAEANLTGQLGTLIEKHLQQVQGFHTRLCRLVGETKDGIEFPQNE